MRPVNLIPPEERAGERAPLRTGPVAYALIGVLALMLIAVTLVVTTNNSISEKEARLASLEQREATARSTAEALAPYAEFAQMSQARDETVTSLAQSRFDWERVLRELARVLPADVWLTSATGTVSPDVQVEGSQSISLRSSIPGPALELVGCGSSQQAVAGFVAALEDIDGVTRVGLNSSEKDPDAGDAGSGVEAGSAEDGGNEDCRTKKFIAQFEIVVAFDAAPAGPEAAANALTPAAPPADSGSAPAETNSTAEQTNQAGEAAEIVTGGAQ